jgi:hypothetical protein
MLANAALFVFGTRRRVSELPEKSGGFEQVHRVSFDHESNLVKTPFLGNLATAAALGQVSESATTWQIFRKMEYAAGMPLDILSAARDQAEQSDPQALQWVSPQRALRLASSIGGLAYGGTDRLIFGTLSHEQIGRTRAYVITKWRQSEIQQVKETKVPPPRTHGEVGDPVGGQCSAVR